MLKPFDLQKALSGEPVITREGDVVTQIYHLKTASNQRQRLCCVIKGIAYYLHENGRIHHNPSLEYGYDLFMADKPPKKYWVNVFKHDDGLAVDNVHLTESDALHCMDSPNYLKTISFELDKE